MAPDSSTKWTQQGAGTASKEASSSNANKGGGKKNPEGRCKPGLESEKWTFSKACRGVHGDPKSAGVSTVTRRTDGGQGDPKNPRKEQDKDFVAKRALVCRRCGKRPQR